MNISPPLATVRGRLEAVRAAVKEAAPGAVETISYGMPAIRQQHVLIYFAAYAHHIGFYPTGAGIAAFQEAIAGYKHSTGAVQFPHDRPLPIELIKKMVAFRAAANKHPSLPKRSGAIR